jgi:hypothetical protein
MMMNNSDTLETTEHAFGAIQTLIAGAQENAIVMGGDRSRLRIGAGYLRLAAQQASALADLVVAVADVDHARAASFDTLFAQIGRDIRDYLAVVSPEEQWLANAEEAVSAVVRREQAAALRLPCSRGVS